MDLSITQTNNHTPSPKMDRKIWGKLPFELLERILSLLPLKTFLSLRSTCKYFRSLIFSPLFISKHSSSSPISSFLLLSHPRSPDYLLYDTGLNSWRNFALPLNRVLSSSPLLSTSTSLLCFSAMPESSNYGFLIYNMLSRASRSIKFPEYGFAWEFTTLITSSNGYKLFCLTSGSGSAKSCAYVYDSTTRGWSSYEGVRGTLGYSYHQQGVFFNGCLYFVTREPFLVVSFDLGLGIWEVLEVDLPDELTFIRLSATIDNDNDNEKEKRKRLFMFGGIGRDGISRSMKIWELDEKVRKWDEIDSVPELMCRKFGSVCYHNYDHVYCFWHEGMICVCCYNWPEVLYYKVSRRTWHWLPKCPLLPNKWSCGFKWFSFVPQLHGYV
ncbi:hypothetical protein QVD17_39254 [Tagetes erecta]|uniref:F-box domain-containing protein n=1 Tax=Tagetes erecta TaxID=13708 RepID=A0AAD8JPP9_TARER|nr:hypothetical protein QVD17_39254 [Tagetes erecta]